ncbi:MAG: class II aldolase/adducin family protein [Pseudomonadota bacterium]
MSQRTRAELGADLCRVMNTLAETGLNTGSAGNASVRTSIGLLVTPSGVKPAAMTPDSSVLIAKNSDVIGAGRPSSEWRFHLDIYRARADAQAIVHVHSPYATVLACLHEPIPAFHYMVAVSGGSRIPCASYATFGTQALSDAVLEALGVGNACLIANHGLVTVGKDLDAALNLTLEVESLARQYCVAKSLGSPVLLDDAEMNRVLEKFKDYGSR